MFAKLKYLPLSRTPWMCVSIQTRNETEKTLIRFCPKSQLAIPMETVLNMNALSAGPPSPAPESASSCLLFPYEGR